MIVISVIKQILLERHETLPFNYSCVPLANHLVLTHCCPGFLQTAAFRICSGQISGQFGAIIEMFSRVVPNDYRRQDIGRQQCRISCRDFAYLELVGESNLHKNICNSLNTFQATEKSYLWLVIWLVCSFCVLTTVLADACAIIDYSDELL